MWILSGAPRRFLNFILKPEIWAHLGVFEGSDWGSKIGSFWLISRLQEWNSKIASVPLKAFTWGGSRQKMNKFGQGVWAIGGVTGFGGFLPCTSITSVKTILRAFQWSYTFRWYWLSRTATDVSVVRKMVDPPYDFAYTALAFTVTATKMNSQTESNLTRSDMTLPGDRTELGNFDWTLWRFCTHINRRERAYDITILLTFLLMFSDNLNSNCIQLFRFFFHLDGDPENAFLPMHIFFACCPKVLFILS